MSTRFEWAHASLGPEVYDPEELAEVADDGNPEREYGMAWMTGSNGCMLTGSPDDLWLLGRRIMAAAEANGASVPTVLVNVDNVYACGRNSGKLEWVRQPAPGESADEWWETVVHPVTGDGHECGLSEHAIYTVSIVKADDPVLLVGDSRTWEG